MKQIIINADDFGINEVITSEIERLIEAGYVTSTTVMANGTCLDEVKRFAILHPEVSFGVHLCLSEFDSITKSEGLFRAGLTDEKGKFIHKAIFKLKNLKEKDVQQAISEELEAQINVIESLGLPISHADSHHHVHALYPLKEVFADVLKRHRITKLRRCIGFTKFKSKLRVFKYIRFIKQNHFYNNLFLMTDRFYSYADYVNNRERICNRKTIELMCHPGHPSEQYRKEISLVESNIALTPRVQLISYINLT